MCVCVCECDALHCLSVSSSGSGWIEYIVFVLRLRWHCCDIGLDGEQRIGFVRTVPFRHIVKWILNGKCRGTKTQ